MINDTQREFLMWWGSMREGLLYLLALKMKLLMPYSSVSGCTCVASTMTG